MEIQRLKKDELIYELAVGRGCNVSPDTQIDKLREALKSAIARELKGELFVEGEFDISEELAVGSAKLAEVRAHLETPDCGSPWRIRTLIFHLNSRFVRLLSQCAGADRNECKRLLTELKSMSATFKAKGEQAQFRAPSILTVSAFEDIASNFDDAQESVAIVGSVHPVNTSQPEAGANHNEGMFNRVHNLSGSLAGLMLGGGGRGEPKPGRQSAGPSFARASSSKAAPAFHKWNCTFSGARDASVNSFILRVEELADARGVSDVELLRGAPEFFSDAALVWYRSVRHQVTDWESLKSLLKKEFLPVDYQASLLEEIRNRQQGKDEASSSYIACMQGLFDRLDFVVPEQTKLELIIRNMSPFYLQNMSWTSIISINHLKEEARKLEVTKSLVDRYENGNRSKGLLEPDLAYKRTFQLSAYSKPFVPPSKPFVRPSRPAVHEVVVPPTVPEPQPEPEVNVISGRFVCWNCKEEGHGFSACPKPKVLFCHRCGRPGATSKNCPSCVRRIPSAEN